jgi:hypothetical protein
VDALAAELHLPPIVCRLLLVRGYSAIEPVKEFLRPRLQRLHSPHLLPDAEQAVDRLVRAVRDSWPDRDGESSAILTTLEETFEINRLWVAGKGFASNERRSSFMRNNFITHWMAEKRAGRTPRVFAKLGAPAQAFGKPILHTAADIRALPGFFKQGKSVCISARNKRREPFRGAGFDMVCAIEGEP